MALNFWVASYKLEANGVGHRFSFAVALRLGRGEAVKEF